VLTPSGSRARVAQKVTVDGTYADFPSSDEVRLVPLAGIADSEGALVVRSRDGVTVVLNDCVFNMDKPRDPLGWLFTTLLGSAPGPRVSRLFRRLAVKDRPALRANLEQLAATDGLRRLIVAHDKLTMGAEAKATLLAATKYL